MRKLVFKLQLSYFIPKYLVCVYKCVNNKAYCYVAFLGLYAVLARNFNSSQLLGCGEGIVHRHCLLLRLFDNAVLSANSMSVGK